MQTHTEREKKIDLPAPLMINTVINRFQFCYYLPECWSLSWLLIPAFLNQPASRKC